MTKNSYLNGRTMSSGMAAGSLIPTIPEPSSLGLAADGGREFLAVKT